MDRVCDQVADLTSPGDVVLLGGSSLADFRVRVAQSHVRDDLTPSYWSLVGVLDGSRGLLTAPLWPLSPPDVVPSTNGIVRLPLSDFDSARRVAERRASSTSRPARRSRPSMPC